MNMAHILGRRPATCMQCSSSTTTTKVIGQQSNIWRQKHWRQQQHIQQQHIQQQHSRNICLCASKVPAGAVLKSGMQGQVDAAYLSAATYLKSIGFTNTAEIARVLDIATNPNSLFVQYNDAKRSTNANARALTAEDDLQPVVEYLRGQGLTQQEVVQVITAHPPVLCYSVEARLQPFWDYLSSIGVPDVAAAVAKRPSLLGLDVDTNLRKIVEYLQYVETPPEQIIQYITTTI